MKPLPSSLLIPNLTRPLPLARALELCAATCKFVSVFCVLLKCSPKCQFVLNSVKSVSHFVRVVCSAQDDGSKCKKLASQWSCSVDCGWLLIKSSVSLSAVTVRSAAPVTPTHNAAILGSGRPPRPRWRARRRDAPASVPKNKGVQWEGDFTVNSTTVVSQVTAEECRRWMTMTVARELQKWSIFYPVSQNWTVRSCTPEIIFWVEHNKLSVLRKQII